ncbi:MAG: 2Fe-2S iron-sulfur cluster-binding protein, partial [Acidiferrobacterales bacterium]
MNRLAAPAGLLVDHDQPISFEFEGKRYEGLAGDCIASALAANDQWLISRSFKYHRPRGVLTMAGQDANVLVQLPTDPNVLADRYPIIEGLRVHGQNYKGSLEKDREAWIGMFAKFLPVGFYYKAFYKPKGAWEKWAPLIRRKAGLGVVDPTVDPGYYDKQYKFYDVVVIGGGPAGMQAAVTAAQAGAEVLLADENPVLGGSLTYARFDVDEPNSEVTRQRLLAAIKASEHIEVMTDAICNGWFTDNWLAVIRGKRLYKVRAREVILAAGAMEQPAIFGNNDLPGV